MLLRGLSAGTATKERLCRAMAPQELWNPLWHQGSGISVTSSFQDDPSRPHHAAGAKGRPTSPTTGTPTAGGGAAAAAAAARAAALAGSPGAVATPLLSAAAVGGLGSGKPAASPGGLPEMLAELAAMEAAGATAERAETAGSGEAAPPESQPQQAAQDADGGR